jgi:hypothetical protein
VRRLGGVAAVILVSLAAAGCSDNSRPAATIDDPAFVRRANTVCRTTVAKLRAPDRKAPSTTELKPATIDATADGLAAVAAELRTLEVRAADQSKVRAWLADWDRFIAVGHRYAAAVKAGDEDLYTKIDDEAVDLAQRIGRFARGNRIDECIL